MHNVQFRPKKGIWLEDFRKVVMITLLKKQNATQCSDHRTISLVVHASKIMLAILRKPIEAKAKSYISNTQFGFRKGVGTRDAIGVMRTLHLGHLLLLPLLMCESSLELGNEVFVCFVDFEKAFDILKWLKMMEILKK